MIIVVSIESKWSQTLPAILSVFILSTDALVSIWSSLHQQSRHISREFTSDLSVALLSSVLSVLSNANLALTDSVALSYK